MILHIEKELQKLMAELKDNGLVGIKKAQLRYLAEEVIIRILRTYSPIGRR